MRLDLTRPEFAINGGKPVRTLPWTDNFTTGEEEKKAVIRVLDSGYLSKFEGSYTPDPPFSFFGGPEVQALEREWCDFYESSHAISMNSATSGLFAAIGALGLGFGDEVIVSPYTMTACALAPLIYGAIPVFADVEEATGCLDPISIKKCISENTKAIVVVHLYGFCSDMPSIMEVAKKHNLLVIEDTAQAMGSRINGQMAGTFGDLGVYSFHSHKNITTLGEGGMLVVKNPKMAEIIPMLRHNGHCGFNFERENYWAPAMGNVDLPDLNGKPIWPNNYCLGEVECALGVKLLDRIDQINMEKRERAMCFIDSMVGLPELEFHREDSKRHNYHLLVARVLNGKRDAFMSKMVEAGVQCVVQYYPLNRYDLYKKAGYGEADCPSTDQFFDNMVSFPFHHMMSDEDFVEMTAITKNVLSSM